MAAILGTAAKGVLAKWGGKAVKAVGKAVGIVKKNPGKVAGGAVTAATGVQVVRQAGGGGAPPPPQLPSGGGAMPGQWSSPGGTALGSVLGGIPVTVSPALETVYRAPKGYVLVEGPGGQKMAVLKSVAYALGLRKRPKKTTAISSRDIQGARKVQGFIQKFSVARKPKTPVKKGRR